MYKKFFKRILDFVLSFILLLLIWPVMLLVAILVKIKLGSPVIFKQKRPGKDERIFNMYKFRTMTDEKDENGNLLPDEKRLTTFGKILRSTSLDELPELINILKGDMSFVGPRPLLVEYLDLYNDEQKKRHNVRPGLTGLAQVNGRNLLTWEERFEYDVKYVNDVTFFNDMKIILKTISVVFKREGINNKEAKTMEPFKGTAMSEVLNMDDINVLILSAGRRVELTNCFKNAALKLKITSKVVAADASDTAPATYFADKKYVIPRINDDKYIDSIIEICKAENIKLIVPTIDTELLKLSENREKIESVTNAKVLISDERVIRACRDKRNTQKFFEENNFGVPKEIKNFDEEINYPVFIKPIDGSSSINTFKVNNKKELEFFSEYIKNPMVQEFIKGEEYTVDAFLDFDSNIITIVPRQRIATRSGEIIKGRIVKDREIIENVKRLLEVLKPIGQITIQCMKTDDGIKYIEINPRFGGGAPMSITAGANSCENLYRLLMGQQLEYNEEYKENLLFLRFDSSIALNENMEKIDG